MSGPSPHLSWRELASADEVPYPHEWRDGRALRLAQAFEDLRAACGGHPLRILSGFRSLEHNRAVGGARASQHVLGRALDLAPPVGMEVREFWHIARGLARLLRIIRGIGFYPHRGSIHIDVRPSARLASWRA